MTIDVIENAFNKPVTIEYETINLGSGAPEEQESGCLDGEFTGDTFYGGRSIRYDFKADNGEMYYFFIDEILSVTEETE